MESPPLGVLEHPSGMLYACSGLDAVLDSQLFPIPGLML